MIPCLASAVMPLASYPDSRYGYDDEAMMVVALPGAFWPDWSDRIAYLRASGEAPDANTLIPTRAIEFGGPIQFAADSPLEGWREMDSNRRSRSRDTAVSFAKDRLVELPPVLDWRTAPSH
jgi:hypothetical protein